jgi:hypothetical protein
MATKRLRIIVRIPQLAPITGMRDEKAENPASGSELMAARRRRDQLAAKQ